MSLKTKFLIKQSIILNQKKAKKLTYKFLNLLFWPSQWSRTQTLISSTFRSHTLCPKTSPSVVLKQLVLLILELENCFLIFYKVRKMFWPVICCDQIFLKTSFNLCFLSIYVPKTRSFQGVDQTYPKAHKISTVINSNKNCSQPNASFLKQKLNEFI